MPMPMPMPMQIQPAVQRHGAGVRLPELAVTDAVLRHHQRGDDVFLGRATK
jgi:hypothetical protein